MAQPSGPDEATPSAAPTLRLLSYNIQTGISTNRYRHYFTRSLGHVLPSSRRVKNLDRIGTLVSEFDIVGLQEVDGGSLRSGYINQVEYLAWRGAFPYWHSQLNRNLGRLAQHSNGLLSRITPTEISEHKLPGLIPGRGALMARYGSSEDCLVVLIIHLALSPRAREQQMAYIAELVRGYRNVVLMGDMNCRAHDINGQRHSPLERSGLVEPVRNLNTYPSWQPQRSIDRVLITPSVRVRSIQALDCTYSDHLPVAIEVELPKEVSLLP